jgi:hypothetical protein
VATVRNDRSDRIYEINNLLDKLRTEFYELLDFDPESVNSAERERRRREVLYLVADLRVMAENL